MKTNRYTIEDASGKLSSFTVPVFIDPKQLAGFQSHSLVYLHVKAGTEVYGVGYLGKVQAIAGPAVVMIEHGEFYLVPRIPANQADSYAIWKEYGPKNTEVNS